MKTFKPLFFIVALVLVVGLACSAGGGGSDTPPSQPEQPQATQPPQQEPPTAVPPTDVPPTEVPPTPTEAQASALQFFREEFDVAAALDNWDFFTLGSGEDDNLVIEQEDDHLLIDMGDEDLYLYYLYFPYDYDNVSLALEAENRGRNNNNVSLVCRVNLETPHWYEFSVESGGLWYLYAFDGKYNRIANGGTNALRQGKEVNEYKMVCEDDEITLYVNGDELQTVRDTKFGFSEGLVGFNISSLNVLPITVEVNWFEISEP